MAEIKARSRRLFDSPGLVDPARLVKRPSIKALQVNRQASTVAAYFTREAELNPLLPAQRHTLRRINKQYFDLRRSVLSDPRLTRQDKAQLVSVLTFERLKAREVIQNPQHHTEVVFMGSAEIRNLIKGVEDETPTPAFSFTGTRGLSMDKREPEGVRVRVKRVLDNFSKRLEPAQKERDQDRERELNAKDLYTRKATFSQNVHYLDKKTDKTLFVDTGKAIVMRRTGISESGVAVALQLAKERFGSTLSINGTDEFKQLVVEAAAKNGIDVHFTDKSMNDALAQRSAELEIEREGQGISQPSVVDMKVMQDKTDFSTDISAQAEQAAADSVPAQSNLVALDAKWLATLDLTEQQVAGSDIAMGKRGENHAGWLVGYSDNTPQAVEMVSKYLEDDAYREGFKTAMNDLYGLPTNSPQDLDAIDVLTGFALDLVSTIEDRNSPEAQPAPDASQRDRKVIEGTLVSFGSAPYLHNEKLRDKPPSYFVEIKLDSGKSRTVWGVGLQDAMSNQQATFKEGDRIRLEDLGTVPVQVPVTQSDGSVVQTTTNRREWSAELLEPEKSRAVSPGNQLDHPVPVPSRAPVLGSAVVAPASVASGLANTAPSQPTLILFDEVTGHLWTDQGFARTTDLAQAVLFTPDESISKAFELSAVHGGIVEIHQYHAGLDESFKLTTTDQIDAWPVAEAVYRRAGLEIDRDQFLASRDAPVTASATSSSDAIASEHALDPRSTEGFAPDETYTEMYIQVEEDGPQMD